MEIWQQLAEDYYVSRQNLGVRDRYSFACGTCVQE